MHRPCPDCGARLWPVHLVELSQPNQRFGLSLGGGHASRGERDGLPVDGLLEIHACAGCCRVFFYTDRPIAPPKRRTKPSERQRRLQAYQSRIETAAAADPVDLETLADVIADPKAPDNIRTEALLHVQRLEPAERLIALVRQTLPYPEASKLVATAIRALAATRSREAVVSLARLFETAIAQDRVRIIHALSQVGGRDAGRALSRWLDHPELGVATAAVRAFSDILYGDLTVAFLLEVLRDPREEVVLEGIRGLRHCAGPTAIPHLRDAAKGLFRDRDVKEAANRAIAAIEERFSVSAGSVAIVDDAEQGRVSVDTSGGAVSIDDD